MICALILRSFRTLARNNRAGRPGFLAGLVIAAGLFVTLPVKAGSVDEDIDAAMKLFWWGDFDELDAHFEHARAHPERRADGWSEWGLMQRGVGHVFSPSNDDLISEAYYKQMIDFTSQWAAARPKSRLARLFHARALFQLGWWYRGGEFSDKVPAMAWRNFQEKVTAAIDDLRSHADLVAGDNLTNKYLIDFGRSAGWSLEQQWAIARQALDRKPDDLMIYLSMLESSRAKWGGGPAAVDRVVQEAVRRTQQKSGLEFYATIYALEAKNLQGAFFEQSYAQWPKLRDGFRDALSHWSSTADLNDFAYIACLARDKVTAAELIDRLAGKPDLARWPARSDYEQCTAWAKGS